jgi:hypothetical protein
VLNHVCGREGSGRRVERREQRDRDRSESGSDEPRTPSSTGGVGSGPPAASERNGYDPEAGEHKRIDGPGGPQVIGLSGQAGVGDDRRQH